MVETGSLTPGVDVFVVFDRHSQLLEEIIRRLHLFPLDVLVDRFDPHNRNIVLLLCLDIRVEPPPS